MLEPVRLRDWCEVFKISCVGELVDYADGVRRVVDDMPGYCRPDESDPSGHDDAVYCLQI